MLAPLLVLQIPLTLVQFCLFPNEAAASLSVTPKLLGRKYYEDYSVFQPGFFYFFFCTFSVLIGTSLSSKLPQTLYSSH